MWIFKGKYTGEAKVYLQKIKKKEAIMWSIIGSLFIIITCIMIGVAFPIEDSLADELICVCGGFIGVLAINLALFLDYRRAPKSNFEINNNGFQYTESGFVRVLPLYKLDPFEYHDDFIVVAKKYILQKELLVQGDWRELKLLLEKVEESLETDNPMYQIEEAEPQIFVATVISKRIHEKFVAGVTWATPVGQFQYFATFQLENGEGREYEIGQEWFEKIEEGQAGELVLVNGKFFCFDNEADFIEEN